MVVNKVIADKCKTTGRLDERVREGSFVIEKLQDENRDRKPGKGKTCDITKSRKSEERKIAISINPTLQISCLQESNKIKFCVLFKIAKKTQC